MQAVLSEMIWTIYRAWFVDYLPVRVNNGSLKSDFFSDELLALYPSSFTSGEFGEVPQGWQIKKLSDFVQKIQDSTSPGDHLSERYYVPIDQIDRRSLTLRNWLGYEDAKSSLILFSKNDILLGAMRPYFHKVCVAPFDGITRTTCFVLRPKIQSHLWYCAALVNSPLTMRYANDSSLGSTMPYAIWENGLADFKVVAPPEEVIQMFCELVSSMMVKIRDAGKK